MNLNRVFKHIVTFVVCMAIVLSCVSALADTEYIALDKADITISIASDIYEVDNENFCIEGIDGVTDAQVPTPPLT